MRKCTICIHPMVEQINFAILEGKESFRTISHQFGVSVDALKRHAKNHIPKTLVKSQKAKEEARADSLIEKMKELQEKTDKILSQAEERGDLKTCLIAIRESRENVNLLAKLLGELQEGLTVNILTNPEWIALRTKILEALEPYPEAKRALAEKLKC